MKDARWELTAKLGKDISTWSWGRLHQLTLRNQTLGTEGPDLLQRALNRGPWDLGGGEAAVNATGWNAAGGYEVIWVPSMRMVVNVGDWDKSRWINLTGASGHAFSAHYTDQTDKWVEGELLDWSFGGGRASKAVHRRQPDAQETARPGRPGAEAQRSGGRDHGVHGVVVRFIGNPRDHLVVVQQDDQRGVRPGRREPGQHPVVRPAAAPQPHPAAVHGQAGQQDRVRVQDRVRAEPRPVRLQQPPGRRARGARAPSYTAQSRSLSAHEDRQQHPYAPRPQRVQQGMRCPARAPPRRRPRRSGRSASSGRSARGRGENRGGRFRRLPRSGAVRAASSSRRRVAFPDMSSFNGCSHSSFYVDV